MQRNRLTPGHVLLWLGFSLGACARADRQRADTQRAGSPSAQTSAPSASGQAALTCSQIRAALQAHYARFAKQPQRCAADTDCTLYGGPECPNQLVRSCPGAISKRTARALSPLEQAWNHQACGAYLWSPYQREVTCTAGLCTAR